MAAWVRSRWLDVAWLLLWGLASSAWFLTAASQLGATFDEPFYVSEGLQPGAPAAPRGC